MKLYLLNFICFIFCFTGNLSGQSFKSEELTGIEIVRTQDGTIYCLLDGEYRVINDMYTYDCVSKKTSKNYRGVSDDIIKFKKPGKNIISIKDNRLYRSDSGRYFTSKDCELLYINDTSGIPSASAFPIDKLDINLFFNGRVIENFVSDLEPLLLRRQDGAVFYFDNSVKKLIPDMVTLNCIASFYNGKISLRELSNNELDNVKDGNNLPSFQDGSILKIDNGKYFFIQNCSKALIDENYIRYFNNATLNNIFSIDSTDLQFVPDSKNINLPKFNIFSIVKSSGLFKSLIFTIFFLTNSFIFIILIYTIFNVSKSLVNDFSTNKLIRVFIIILFPFLIYVVYDNFLKYLIFPIDNIKGNLQFGFDVFVFLIFELFVLFIGFFIITRFGHFSLKWPNKRA